MNQNDKDYVKDQINTAIDGDFSDKAAEAVNNAISNAGIPEKAAAEVSKAVGDAKSDLDTATTAAKDAYTSLVGSNGTADSPAEGSVLDKAVAVKDALDGEDGDEGLVAKGETVQEALDGDEGLVAKGKTVQEALDGDEGLVARGETVQEALDGDEGLVARGKTVQEALDGDEGLVAKGKTVQEALDGNEGLVAKGKTVQEALDGTGGLVEQAKDAKEALGTATEYAGTAGISLKEAADDAKSAYTNLVGSNGSPTDPDTDSALGKAVAVKNALDGEDGDEGLVARGETVQEALDGTGGLVKQAKDAKEALDTATTNARNAEKTLEEDIDDAKKLLNQLEAYIPSGATLKETIDSQIAAYITGDLAENDGLIQTAINSVKESLLIALAETQNLATKAADNAALALNKATPGYSFYVAPNVNSVTAIKAGFTLLNVGTYGFNNTGVGENLTLAIANGAVSFTKNSTTFSTIRAEVNRERASGASLLGALLTTGMGTIFHS
ncbi:MAG: hypothetical protein LBD44_01080 [Spirochaetaceae bacterium]|jgi:predicted RNase H-like HicB family nuclease|nr:hypothetical protein [Spirochaetaceae bacterium]